MKTSKRLLLALGTFATLLPLGVVGVEAAGLTAPVSFGATGFATPLDRTIGLYLQQRVAAGKLTAAEASVAGEQLQMQFNSLSRSEQAKVLASARNVDSPESVGAAIAALKSAAVAEAQAALADVNAADSRSVNDRAQGLAPKLGGDGDTVFISTVGPCRIYDTRNGPGQLPGTAARQIYALSTLNGYNFAGDQGGTGVTGAGNCTPMAFFTTKPVSVVAIVTVINPVTSGALQAWNGGTTLIVGGAVLAWNPGDRGSNTTVIPMDRTIAAYPGSGAKRDFAVYNNSGGPVDVIIDVVGYFIENRATELDCTFVSGTPTNIPAFTSQVLNAPSCPAGYTQMTARVSATSYGLFLGSLYPDLCRVGNFTAAPLGTAQCDAYCCRVPGR